MCNAVVSRRLCKETCWLFHNFSLGSGNEVLSCSDHDAKLSSSRAGDSPSRGTPRQQLAWHIRPLQQLHKERSTLCGYSYMCMSVHECAQLCPCLFRYESVCINLCREDSRPTALLYLLNLIQWCLIIKYLSFITSGHGSLD